MVEFEWDCNKNKFNLRKHGVPFELAQYAFSDPKRMLAQDLEHSQKEKRFICIGRVGDGIMTVRFTYRKKVVRIFGAGYWRKGRGMYEKENSLHK